MANVGLLQTRKVLHIAGRIRRPVDRKLGIEDCLRKSIEVKGKGNGWRYTALDCTGARYYQSDSDRGPISHLGTATMIVLGIILLVLGLLLPQLSILTTIGVILIIVGVIFWILGASGHDIGGRARWY